MNFQPSTSVSLTTHMISQLPLEGQVIGEIRQLAAWSPEVVSKVSDFLYENSKWGNRFEYLVKNFSDNIVSAIREEEEEDRRRRR